MKLSEDFLVRSEGGARVLLECLARYRALRRLLAAPTPLQWPMVSQRTRDVLRAEPDAGVARDRVALVHRREATELLGLVDSERERLLNAVRAELGRTAGGGRSVAAFGAELSELETLSFEQELYQPLDREFRLERHTWTILTILTAAIVPGISWLWVSDLGRVPTLLSLRALLTEPPGLAGLAAWATAAAMTWRALAQASWLGRQAPWLVSSAFAAGAASAAVSFPLGDGVTALAAATVAALLSASAQLLRAAWG